MGGATSVMPVIRDAFSQQAVTSQWADTIDWTVRRCDWLQVASSRIILYTRNTMLIRAATLVKVLQENKFYRCDGGLTAVQCHWIHHKSQHHHRVLNEYGHALSEVAGRCSELRTSPYRLGRGAQGTGRGYLRRSYPGDLGSVWAPTASSRGRNSSGKRS